MSDSKQWEGEAPAEPELCDRHVSCEATPYRCFAAEETEQKAWRSDRWYRPLGVAPFLLPALHDVWPAHAEFFQETFKVPHIYCLLPRFELWSKRFSEWTDADWHDPENFSALWDLSGKLAGKPGQVLWTRGTHDIHEMPKVGLPAPEFLESARRNS